MSNKVHVFAVEGNIGAGKTTLMKRMQQRFPELAYYFEPIADWQNVRTTDGLVNMLDKASKKPKKHAFKFQIMALTSQLEIINSLPKSGHRVVLVERSILSNKHVFAKLLKDKDIITETEWATYNFMFEKLIPKDFAYSGFIFLNSCPETCLSRINFRSRPEERNLPLRYLQKLDKYHQELLMKRDDVLVLGNDSNTVGFCDFSRLVDEIGNFIQQKVEVQGHDEKTQATACRGLFDDEDFPCEDLNEDKKEL